MGFPVLGLAAVLVEPAAAQVVVASSGDVFDTIGDALDHAAVGDTLTLDPGTYEEHVDVTFDVTIEGAADGAAIAPTSVAVDAVVEVDAGVSLTLHQLTLTSSAVRGVELEGDGLLVLDGVMFLGTVAAGDGGGISAAFGGTLDLTDVVFDGTSAADRGGAVFLSDADFTCTRCRFLGTSAGAFGGAIYDTGSSAITLTDSTFLGTSAGFVGGAVALESNASFTAVRTTFCGTSAFSAPGVWGSTDTAVLTNDVFADPSADPHDGSGVVSATAGVWTVRNNHFVGADATVDASNLGTTLTATNNLFVSTGAHDVHLAAVGTFDWNVFDGAADLSGVVLGANDREHVEPKLTAYVADGDCATDVWWPTWDSPLLDTGDDTWFDPDGSRSDVGAFGGPAADPALHADTDADGATFLHDCDDADGTAFPGADEVCDGVDDNCDGTVDETPVDEGWWCDADGDGQGPDVLGVNTCDPPPAADCDGAWLALSLFHAAVSQDCDDGNPEVFFGAVETCAFGDHNCDGDDDRGAVDATLRFTDEDGDGFGTGAGERVCGVPVATSPIGGDCDDTTETTHPDAPDTCDGVDQSCDGADGDATTRPLWFPDADGDGFGSSSAVPVADCVDRSADGYATSATDCDDGDPSVHPDAAELCNLIDDDCNAAVDDVGLSVTWFPDDDGDGFGDLRFPADDDCAPSAVSITTGGDCDDGDSAVHPDAVEVCNGADDDCDGATDADDPDATGLVEVWPDWDGDGFGACPEGPCAGTPACPAETGGATNPDDCGDGDPAVHPGATEIPGNDVDEDCDGVRAEPPGAAAADTPGAGCACTTAPSSPAGAVLALVLLLVTTAARANDKPVVAVGSVDAIEDVVLVVPPPGLLAWATDSEGDVLTAALKTAPDHGTLVVHADGSYVFTPDADDASDTSFTWTASDGVPSEAATMTIHVAAVNDAPVAVPDGPLATVEDEPLLVDPAWLLANDTDVDDAPDRLSVLVDPTTRSDHGTFVFAGDQLLYTPDADYAGPDVLTYWVVDAAGAESALGSVDVDIAPVDDVPRAADDVLGELTPGAPATGNVLANDADPEGEPLAAELVVPAVGAVVTLGADGAFVVEARPGFVGSDGFTYVARDSSLGASAPARATWFVLPGSDPGPDDTGDPGPPCSTTTWFLDADGDGFGTGDALDACDRPPGHAEVGGDCDDRRVDVFPGATETVGDDVDQDCDGTDNTLQPVGACSTGPAFTSIGPLLLLLLLARPARAGPTCGEDTPAEVDSALVAVWDAYAQLDEPGFDRAAKSLALAVACLDHAPAPVQIARLHQGMALVSFVSGQTRAARKSLAAARLLDPGWKLPLDPFAAGHPYRELWEAATDPGPVAPLGRAPDTVWVVDGVERDDAPTQRAFLLQIAEDGAVVWSGYLWSFDEIPDRGQAAARDALETPHVWGLSARVEGRWLTSRQESDQAAVWGDTTGSTPGIGAGLVARWTPVTVVGAEVAASVVGPADAVAGGDVEPAGHAVVLLGGGGWVGVVQPHGAVRVGGAVGRTRAWVGDDQQAWVWTVPSLDLGLEAGVRTDRWRVALTGDGLLASATTLTEVRLGADGGFAFGEGPLAFEAGLLWRSVTVPYEDADGSPLGQRNDQDLRLGVGIGWWH